MHVGHLVLNLIKTLFRNIFFSSVVVVKKMVSAGDASISLHIPVPCMSLNQEGGGGGTLVDQLKSKVPQSGQVFIYREGVYCAPTLIQSKVPQSGQVFIWGWGVGWG